MMLPKQQCIDFDKPVASGYRHLLYHATVDKHAVCNSGLKSSCEVGSRGLGQAVCDEENPMISFTTDRNIGVEIAKDLRTMINIANATYTARNIAESLDIVDSEGAVKNSKGKAYQLSLAEKPAEIFRITVQHPELVKRLIDDRRKIDPAYQG